MVDSVCRPISRMRRGFTLIELLVVIAIIAILAAILFPVFNSAREKARSATCQSNLHQIGLSIFQYAQDNSGHYPTVYGNDIANDPGFGWIGSIQPYMKSIQTFKCPDSPRPQNVLAMSSYAYTSGGANYANYTDYWYNWYVAPTWNNPNAPGVMPGCCTGITAAYLSYASSTVLNGDATYYHETINGQTENCNEGNNRSCDTANTYQSAPDASPYFWGKRHSGGANYGFCDGHVKWLEPQALSGGGSAGIGTAAAPTGSNFTFNIS